MSKSTPQLRRKRRVVKSLLSTRQPIKLIVHISNRQITAQLVEIASGKILASSVSTNQKSLKNLTEKAKWVGADIATKAKAVKIKKVIYDRGSRRYHGRVKALAEAAREGGLEI